jgi:AraC family transcriptional regulator
MGRSIAVRHVDADVSTSLGHVRVVRAAWAEPIDSTGTPDQHWLELSLLPLSDVARGCFPDRWSPHRFERIGALFFLPANRAVRALSECHVQSSVICALRPDDVREWLGDDLEWTDGQLTGSLDLVNPSLKQLVFRLGAEARTPGFGSDALLELMTAQIAIELGRYLRGIETAGDTGGLAPWRLRLIDERLAEQAPEQPGSPALAEVAALCGLSVRHLARGFRASRGCSIGEYIANHRVEQAKRMIAADHSLKSVAHATGFSSPSSFSAAFRRATRETPRAFRDRIARDQRLRSSLPRMH